MIKKIITTKSFELAILVEGDENAERLAILCPGRLDTKDYANFHVHMASLAKKGFLAIVFDPPGTWESPGGIELFTTTNYIQSVHELIEYFGNKPTLLVGHSRGAAVSFFVANENLNVIGVVGLLPNLGAPTPPDQKSREKGYKISNRDLPPGTSKTIEQKVFNLPMSYFEDGEKYNPASAAKSLTKPKMILYGNKDEFMTSEEAEKICSEIPEPKFVKELNSTHDYRYYSEVIQEVDGLIGKFVEEYLNG